MQNAELPQNDPKSTVPKPYESIQFVMVHDSDGQTILFVKDT
jgi:hypothetical protein